MAAILAQIENHRLLEWQQFAPGSLGYGCVGIATVTLPSGNTGVFKLYDIMGQWAEWTGGLQIRDTLSLDDSEEMNYAAPRVVELVRIHDPGSLQQRSSIFPPNAGD